MKLDGSLPKDLCNCYDCVAAYCKEFPVEDAIDFRTMRMFVCEFCGNKRCPHSQWHGFKCSGSNDTDQVPVVAGIILKGSAYVYDEQAGN